VEENKSTGSVFANWHGKVLEPYMSIFRVEIEKINSLPSSEWLITDSDVDDLLELAALFDVRIEHDEEELYNMRVFKRYLGLIKKKAKKVILEDLKPVDPYAQLVNVFKEEDLRELEGEGE